MQKYFEWFKSQENVMGILVVGSFARGEQTNESDLDLMILCDDYGEFIKDQSWISNFGIMTNSKLENWGAVKTIRVFFENKDEVEFNFSTKSWAEINPLDAGTKKVMSDGYKIIYDPMNIFKRLGERI